MTEEIKAIQQAFNEVIAYSQTGIVTPETDDLFNKWLSAKRDFIEAFGGKLIVESPQPINFELSPEEKQERIDDFVQMICDKYMNNSLGDFIRKNKDGFFENKIVYDSSELKIPKGMKLVKAFKFFEEDKALLAEIQAAAAILIQENNFEGKICFSVHPLDFLSASENNHNWRSCHALNGDYRSGNLSYMTDSSTIMCYMKTRDDEILPNFPESIPWNSKKWRVWLYFSENWDMVFAGRQYPFTSQSGMNIIKSLLPKYNLGRYDEWIDASIKTIPDKKSGLNLKVRDEHLFIGGYLVPKHDVIINQPGSLQFNDLTSSATYTPIYAFRARQYNYIPMGWNITDTPKVKIGGRVNCCRCGKKHIELSGSMMCMPCELRFGDCEDDCIEYCPICDERFFFEDGIYIPSEDRMVCENCAENYYVQCDDCGELVNESDSIYIEDEDKCICYDCYQSYKGE